MVLPCSPDVWSALQVVLIHWGQVMHIWISKLTITGPDNDLGPTRQQVIIWTNDGILFIGPLGTNFNEILIKIHTFSFKKMHLNMSSGKRQPSCLCLNVLMSLWGRQSMRQLIRSVRWLAPGSREQEEAIRQGFRHANMNALIGCKTVQLSQRCYLTSTGIAISEIRQLWDHLILKWEFLLLERQKWIQRPST